MTFPRRNFTSETKRLAVKRSGGICECYLLGRRGIAGFSALGCGLKIGVGNTWFEHIVCDGIGGDPTLENCAVLTKTCGRLKSRSYDIPIVAKVKRQQNMRFGIKADSGRPINGSKRSAFRKKVNGQVEWRT